MTRIGIECSMVLLAESVRQYPIPKTGLRVYRLHDLTNLFRHSKLYWAVWHSAAKIFGMFHSA